MTEGEALRTLNLIQGSSAAQVRQAYLDLVKVWHPDRFHGDARLSARAERELSAINEAYSVLTARTPEPVTSSSVKSARQRTTASDQPFAAAQPIADVRQFRPTRVRVLQGIVLGLTLGLALAATVLVSMTRGQNASIARLESGVEVLAPERTGGGALVVTNRSRQDAVLALVAVGHYQRAVYIRAGEQVTVANVAAGLYQVLIMLGSDWAAGRFSRHVSYHQLDQLIRFAEKTGGPETEYTRLTVSLPDATDSTRGIRTTQPFRITQP